MTERFETYLFEYRHGDADWALRIQARDADDARERIKSLAWARYKGRVLADMPAGFGFLEVVTAWFRNILRAS